MSDELVIGLAGGAIGAILAALFAQAGRAWTAWGEVTLDDEEAAERNASIRAWVDDRTRNLLAAMQAIAEEHNARNTFWSGINGAALAKAKAEALHEYRDESSRARIDLARIRAREGAWHWVWRRLRRRPEPALTEETLQSIEPFLDRWREPVKRHDPKGDGVKPLDRTTRTTADALEELPSLNLT